MENLFSRDCHGKLMCKEEARQSVIDSLVATNTFAPKISSVRYHTSVKENGKGVLHTVVTFVDGTTSVVKNDPDMGDEISLVEKEVVLSDGSKRKMLTASESAKEIGLVYAIVKRMVCKLDGMGTVKPKGFINFIRSAVRKARVQDVIDGTVVAERELAKKRAEKRNSDREKLLDTIDTLRKEIEELNRRFSKLSPKGGLVKNGGSDGKGKTRPPKR